MLSGKRFLLGISGGIAAYKIPHLIRLIQKQNGEVRCVVTDHAREFIGLQTLQTLSGHSAYHSLFSEKTSLDHIELSRWADVLLVAPATANILGKMAHGIADDLLSTLYLSFRKKTIVAPAMNHAMWKHPAVNANAEILARRGVVLAGPESGELACRESGEGRMAEPEFLLHWLIQSVTEPFLAGKKALITGGPTREAIDPVRFLSNASSGKMAIALAHAAWHAGAEVRLVMGPSEEKILPAIPVDRVVSASEMFAAVKNQFHKSDVFISNAAVADARPSKSSPTKIGKRDLGKTILLEPTPDILAWAGSVQKRNTVIGFALETDHAEKNAREKLQKKKCDYLILNTPLDLPGGIGGDTNAVKIFNKKGIMATLKEQPKPLLASQILKLLFSV